MIIFLTFLSFVLEFLFNSVFYNTIYIPLIVISLLILIEPFFNNNKEKYLIYSFVVGFLYDYVFTGTYFFSSGIFLLIGLSILFINRVTPNNFLITLLEIILFICLYRVICFLFFSLLGIVNFDGMVLLKSIYSSLIFNIIFSSFLYFVLYFVSIKFNIRRIN